MKVGVYFVFLFFCRRLHEDLSYLGQNNMFTGYNPTVISYRGGSGVPLIYSIRVYNLSLEPLYLMLTI